MPGRKRREDRKAHHNQPRDEDRAQCLEHGLARQSWRIPLKNPFEKMGLVSGDTRETPHATFEQLMIFRAKAIEMGYPSLATAAMMGWELLQRKAHIFIRFEVKHYRPTDRPNQIYVINWKTGTGAWEPLFDEEGEPLYPTLIKELDEIKAKRPTGGMMRAGTVPAARGSAKTSS